jgi:hypothetical protein
VTVESEVHIAQDWGGGRRVRFVSGRADDRAGGGIGICVDGGGLAAACAWCRVQRGAAEAGAIDCGGAVARDTSR